MQDMYEMAGLTSQDVLLVWHSPNEWWRLFLHCDIFLRELQTKKGEPDALEVGGRLAYAFLCSFTGHFDTANS